MLLAAKCLLLARRIKKLGMEENIQSICTPVTSYGMSGYEIESIYKDFHLTETFTHDILTIDAIDKMALMLLTNLFNSYYRSKQYAY